MLFPTFLCEEGGLAMVKNKRLPKPQSCSGAIAEFELGSDGCQVPFPLLKTLPGFLRSCPAGISSLTLFPYLNIRNSSVDFLSGSGLIQPLSSPQNQDTL